MNEEANIIIDKISKISNGIKSDLKPLIVKLSKNIGDNINHPEIQNMAHLCGVDDPKLTDVARIMNRIREKQSWQTNWPCLLSRWRTNIRQYHKKKSRMEE